MAPKGSKFTKGLKKRTVLFVFLIFCLHKNHLAKLWGHLEILRNDKANMPVGQIPGTPKILLAKGKSFRVKTLRIPSYWSPFSALGADSTDQRFGTSY